MSWRLPVRGSGLVATAPFLIEPSIALQPDDAAPTEAVRVNGTGFEASSSVTVYLNDIDNGGPRTAIETVKTNSKGSFYFIFPVPHVPGGSHATVETDVLPSVGRKVEAPFHVAALLGAGPSEVNPPDALCESTGQPPPSSTELAMIGAGFGPDTVVTLDLVGDSRSSSRRLGTAPTDASGDFTTTLTVPAAPYGKYFVEGEGKTFYGTKQSAFSKVISVGFDACDNPSVGNGSVTDQWQGVGTDANSSVNVVLDGTPVMETIADADGSWTVGPNAFPSAPGRHTYGIEVKLGGKDAEFTGPLEC